LWARLRTATREDVFFTRSLHLQRCRLSSRGRQPKDLLSPLAAREKQNAAAVRHVLGHRFITVVRLGRKGQLPKVVSASFEQPKMLLAALLGCIRDGNHNRPAVRGKAWRSYAVHTRPKGLIRWECTLSKDGGATGQAGEERENTSTVRSHAFY
jgi:hypothetical protein